jgi:hypothetical protein
MNVDKDLPHPRVEIIHNPHLRGEATLLMPGGILVRWPDREPLPDIGAEFTGMVVHVPPRLRDTVQITLFCGTHLTR